MSSEEVFEYFLRLGLREGEIAITFQFPEKITDQAVLNSVPNFCFPEGPKAIGNYETKKVESFSFVSTLSDGNKRFGYCRRYYFPDKPPECYCLLSFSYVFNPASFSIFSQLIDIVELKSAEGDKSVYGFLHSVLAQPFPDPGQTIQAQTFTVVTKEDGQVDYLPETFRLTRSDDDYEYLEYVSYENLFRSLDLNTIMLIFQSVLSERRIVLASSSLGKLSSCMDAVFNIAYPFTWQYVFVPILPVNMLSFISAPMPFLIGILSSCLDKAMQEPIEEGVLIVDLDKNTILSAPDLDQEFMPPFATEKLKKSLQNAVASDKRNMAFSIIIAHNLLKFFISIFSDYSKYFEPVTKQGKSPDTSNSNKSMNNLNEWTFNMDKFLKSRNHESRRFLAKFKEYQLFTYFIQERESWASKNLLGYCILTRAYQAKKKDSIAAVTSKIKSKMGRMLASWQETHTNPSSARQNYNEPHTPQENATDSMKTDSMKTDSMKTDDSTSEIESSTTDQPSGADGKPSTSCPPASPTDNAPLASSTPPVVGPKPKNFVLATSNHPVERSKLVAPKPPPKPPNLSKESKLRPTSSNVASDSTQTNSTNRSMSAPTRKAGELESRDFFDPSQPEPSPTTPSVYM